MKLINKFWILALGATSMVSCTDLTVYPEGDIITSEQKKAVIEKIPGRLAADINGMYSFMSQQYGVLPASERDDDFGYPAVCLSQDLNGSDMVSTDDNYNWFSTASAFEDRTYTYANPLIRFALFYKQIYLANRILASIPDSTDKVQLKQYKGQALAIRAFDYFTLVQNYQFTYKGNEDKPAIPIVTNKMVGDPSSNPRAKVSDVYKLILADLNEAIALLDGYQRTSKGLVDQNVAYGLRARVNLVMQNWAAAASDAATARAGYTFLSKASVSAPSFNSATASSWMWALIISPVNITNQYGCWPAKLSSFAGNSYTAGVGCYKMINTLLWNKIPNTDVRKGWWVDASLKSPLIDSISWPGYTGQAIGPLNISDVKVPFLPYTNVKFGAYKDVMGNGENASDWCIMRAEEMLLIQAEGLAMSGDVPGAKTLLQDFIQTYRDASYTCTASTDLDMQNEIWLQRRIELWGEGFAFSDIMRLKKNIVRFNSNVVTNHPDAFKFNLASTDGWLLLRIPLKEISTNVGIPETANNNDGVLPKSGDGAGLTDGVTD